ncbi:signal peptide peptidase SppA [Elongatibacter sediminis]|uniref:Signal peptide peptidase SppA n=1 Tax=Elongatibacter sediminis TaxID=3119006 RepID=A0AAW9R7M3_9GAMM
MSDRPRSALGRFFNGIWRFIDGTRKLVLNLVFFGILFLVIAALLDSGEALVVQPRTALLIDPQGFVVEEYSGSPLDQALQQATEDGRRETRLRDMVDAIRRAADDDRIERLVIDPSRTWGIGMASLLELEAAITDFRASGKPVVALAENLSQQQYYLAALADEVWLHPDGMIWIDGFAAYRNFYREGLDKLEVEVNLFRVGEYKSAMEPFIRNDMSEDDREATLFWLGSLWQQYLEAVSRQRGLPLVDLSNAIRNFPDRLEAVGGDFAELALQMGLADRLMSRQEAHQELARLGQPADGGTDYRKIGFDAYLKASLLSVRPSSGSEVAVVVAEGDIVRGRQPPGMIGAETMVERLRRVADDSDVRAVVLRIDSPGGETFASEMVRREIQSLRETNRTVVVSMGDVAASGAYWIAMGADEVWASPATITGSIGVFGFLPTFSRPLANLGIHTDGVGTTPLAGKLRLDLPLDEDLRRIFQTSTEQTYQQFIELVSEARGLSQEDVEEVARGRVWSGLQAKERGLVDQTGTLADAIDAAARIAGLGSDYRVRYEEPALSSFERFMLDMTGQTLARTGLVSLLGRSLLPAWAGQAHWDSLLRDLRLIAGADGGFSLAAHCLCRIP